MRVVALAAFAFVLAAQGPAAAAECGKGMMWPYVRSPGDCLTDEEIKAGQKGAFSGPLNTNPDIANLKVETPAQVNNGGSGGGGLLDNIFGGIPSLSGDDGVYDSLGPAGLIKRPANLNEVACNKGTLWPFYRSPGDCLTDTEKRAQGNSVYRADELPGGATPANATRPATPAAQPASAQAPTCKRSVFWPFVRNEGDCQTDQEKQDAAAANKQ